MKVYIGADHRGFSLKEQIKKHLSGIEIEDIGAHEVKEEDDYPDYAEKVAKKVAADPNSVGIILCGSGIGVDIAANKVKGARCGLGLNTKQIKEARQADNINILALAADHTEPHPAKEIVEAFLSTTYQPEERRERRLKKIQQLENESNVN